MSISVSVQGKGGSDRSCHFQVRKVKDKGYVSLESVGSPGMMVGLTKEGKIRPTVDTGDQNTRLFVEVIKCELVELF